MSRSIVLLAAAAALALLVALFFDSPASNRFEIANQSTAYELDAAGKTVRWAAEEIARETGVPSEYLLFYRERNRLFDGVSSVGLRKDSELLGDAAVFEAGEAVDVFVRPVLGDHVHTIYNIWVQTGSEYSLLRPMFDDALEHVNPAADGETEYFFFKLHNGLHTHGKSLMHVHPWTSPLWFHETDGLGATLGNWLDDVGVTLRKPPYREALSLEFRNDIYLISKPEFVEIINNTSPSITTKSFGSCLSAQGACVNTLTNGNGSSWKALYWKHYLDFQNDEAPEIVTEDIGSVWLGRNLGVVVLVYGDDDDVLPGADSFLATIAPPSLHGDIVEVTTARIDVLQSDPEEYMNLGQFDGRRYPSPRAEDDRYGILDRSFAIGSADTSN